MERECSQGAYSSLWTNTHSVVERSGHFGLRSTQHLLSFCLSTLAKRLGRRNSTRGLLEE